MYYLVVWPLASGQMLRSSGGLRLPDRPKLFGAIVTPKRRFVSHFLMETFITSEQDLSDHVEPLDKDVVLVHFKMVGVGPNTLAQTGYLGRNICEVVRKQPGFFVVSQKGVGLREAMHDLVNRFCDTQEGKYESTNS